MIKGSDLIGLSIIKENKNLDNYYINDLIYGKKNLKVLAVTVGKKDFAKKFNKIILFNKIRAISNKGIVIASEKDMFFLHQIPEIEKEYFNPTKVIGFSIYDYENNLIGIIKDTVIEIKSGKVLAFIISEGALEDLIRGYSILPIIEYYDFNNDYLRVNKEVIESILPQGGGLKKLLGIDKVN